MTALEPEPGLTSITQTGYEQIRRRHVRGCADPDPRFHDEAMRGTDRDGRRAFYCPACGAWRYSDDPTWHRP